MRFKVILVLIVAAGIAGFLFFQKKQLQQVRSEIVADYLRLAQSMSGLMMEVSISGQFSQPSRFSLATIDKQNQAFQKKYRFYRGLPLYAHNRLGDFLSSVDVTVKNYRQLALEGGRQSRAARSQRIEGLHKLFLHNAVYCAMAVGKDKDQLAISEQQRNELLQTFFSIYGGVFVEYSKRSSKPPFLISLILIKDSLQTRKPLP